MFLGLVVRVQDPLPIEQVRWLIFDTYQRIKPRPYDPTLPVKIVDIDEESLARLGQWPWPRHTMADLVRRLGRAGAAVIALDIVFAEHDRTSPERILPLWPPLPEVEALRKRVDALPSHDGMLAEAMPQARVVTGFILTREPGPNLPMVKGTVAFAGDDPRPFMVAYGGAATNLPEIEAAAAGNGSLVGTPDRDQVIRRVPLVVRIGDTLYPSLSAEALRVAQGAKSHLIKSSGASGETAFGKQTGINNIRIGRLVVPTDANGRLFVHYSPRTPNSYIPAWEVLEPDFNPERVRGQIILVGTSAQGLHDIRATPLDPVTPGVEIHAQVIEHIMTGEFLQRPDFATGAELLFMLVLGLALTLMLPRIGAIWSTLLGGLTTVVAVGGSWYAFDTLGWLVDPVVPSLVAGMVFLSQTLLVYLRSESERRQVRDAFSHYLSPVLVEQLAEHPEQLKLGGEIKPMSILFSDIRGFTQISETFKDDPAGLTHIVNRYFTAMTDRILASGGTIDKYMGDAVMAFWNAPLDDDDHARHMCNAALDMLDGLEKLNKKLSEDATEQGKPFVDIDIGIGLNTGKCIVGNMGSDQRFMYSVIGDDVNLASRLEAQCRTYGVTIIVSDNTYEMADDLAVLELDLIRVKGKALASRIYALIGLAQLTRDDAFQKLSGLHSRMLDAYRGQRWREAREQITRCRIAGARHELNALYDLYEARIAEFEITPPPTRLGWCLHRADQIGAMADDLR